MRRIVKISVLLALIYFVVGFIIAKFNLLPSFTYQVYLEFSSIVGGFASIIGLLTLGSPALTTKDLKELELESFKKVVSLTEDMKNADNELLQRSNDMKKADGELLKRSSEISGLERKKKQMELLMQKACIAIYLNDKHKSNTEQLVMIYKENKNIERKLQALEEEIEQSGDQQLIKEIMNIVESKVAREEESIGNETSFIESLNNLFYLKPTILGVGLDLNAMLNDILKNRRKR